MTVTVSSGCDNVTCWKLERIPDLQTYSAISTQSCFLSAGTMIAIVVFFKVPVRAIGGQAAKRWLYGFVSNIGLALTLVAKWSSVFFLCTVVMESWN